MCHQHIGVVIFLDDLQPKKKKIYGRIVVLQLMGFGWNTTSRFINCQDPKLLHFHFFLIHILPPTFHRFFRLALLFSIFFSHSLFHFNIHSLIHTYSPNVHLNFEDLNHMGFLAPLINIPDASSNLAVIQHRLTLA